MTAGIPPPGYRLPDATRLGGLTLQVTDLDRSLSYYQGVLGLNILSRDAATASLAPLGSLTPLLRLRARSDGPSGPRGERLGLYHFALLVPDRVSLGRFLSHLAAIGVQASSADHAVSEALYLWDPDGLGIEVYSDRPMSEWRANGRERFMTTQRLDTRSLIQSGGGVQWSGMPAGTVLGHMHLQVSDLTQADDFYHRALGFDRMVWTYPGALFLAAGGYHHHLGTNTWAANLAPRPDHEPGLLEWQIVLPTADDVSAAVESCQTAGYAAANRGEDWALTDPWGSVVTLVAERR